MNLIEAYGKKPGLFNSGIKSTRAMALRCVLYHIERHPLESYEHRGPVTRSINKNFKNIVRMQEGSRDSLELWKADIHLNSPNSFQLLQY